jgi:hypothetical protein
MMYRVDEFEEENELKASYVWIHGPGVNLVIDRDCAKKIDTATIVNSLQDAFFAGRLSKSREIAKALCMPDDIVMRIRNRDV